MPFSVLWWCGDRVSISSTDDLKSCKILNFIRNDEEEISAEENEKKWDSMQ